MLNQNTRNVLGQLGSINNSMIITYPVSTIIMGKSVQAFLNLEKLGETEFDEIGLFNISEFNSVINVIDDPEITNNDGTLTISNGSNSIKYGTTSIDIIESECRGNPGLIDKVKENEKVASFSLSLKELDRIKKMSGLLKDLSDLVITSDGNDISIVVTSKERSSNNYTVQLEGNSTENISLTMVMEVISKLPASDFEVSVYKSKKGSLVAVFDSVNVDGLSLIIAAKAV